MTSDEELCRRAAELIDELKARLAQDPSQWLHVPEVLEVRSLAERLEEVLAVLEARARRRESTCR